MPHVLRGLAILLNVLWVYLGDKIGLWVQVAIPIITVLLWWGAIRMQTARQTMGQRKSHYRRGQWFVFVYYLCILAVLLFFGGLFHVTREQGGNVNLVLMETIDNYISYYRRTGSFVSVANLAGNAVILLPLGVMLPVIFPALRRFWVTIPLLALVAVGIEVTQYLTATGTADVDDSLLNFIGAVVGYIPTRCVQLYHRER